MITESQGLSSQDRLGQSPIIRSPDEPGTLGEMLGAVVLSLVRSEQNGTSAKHEWPEARLEIERRVG